MPDNSRWHLNIEVDGKPADVVDLDEEQIDTIVDQIRNGFVRGDIKETADPFDHEGYMSVEDDDTDEE